MKKAWVILAIFFFINGCVAKIIMVRMIKVGAKTLTNG